MALKAKKPELTKPGKPHILLSGPSGSGKTTWTLGFNNLYLIDCEGGAENSQYKRKLLESGGVYMGQKEGSQDFDSVIEEIKTLTSEEHDFRALSIDSVSYLYMLEAAEAEERVGSDYAKDRKEANKPSRRLLRYLENLDMVVILIAHSKDKWERRGKEIINTGTTFDFFDKTDYLLDLWLEVHREPTPQGNWEDGRLIVKKSRIESMPKGLIFDMNYKTFAELYGKEIVERKPVPIELASPEQITRIKDLITVMNISEESQDKVLRSFKVDNWDELTKDQMAQCIEGLEKKILSANMKEK